MYLKGLWKSSYTFMETNLVAVCTTDCVLPPAPTFPLFSLSPSFLHFLSPWGCYYWLGCWCWWSVYAPMHTCTIAMENRGEKWIKYPATWGWLYSLWLPPCLATLKSQRLNTDKERNHHFKDHGWKPYLCCSVIVRYPFSSGWLLAEQSLKAGASFLFRLNCTSHFDSPHSSKFCFCWCYYGETELRPLPPALDSISAHMLATARCCFALIVCN